jgi:hypothetical protein
MEAGFWKLCSLETALSFPLPRREGIKGRVNDFKTPSPLPSPAKGRGCFLHRQLRTKTGSMARNEKKERQNHHWFCLSVGAPSMGAILEVQVLP